MTWNLSEIMSLIKAAQHKYTHRKLVGRDPKTNRLRYRYYYKEHHGGGITGSAFEEGSAFKLTWKGRRGHFHIKSVDGDMITISHDGRPGVEIPPIHRDELRALLEKQHAKAETESREKAQANRRKGRKKAAKKKAAKKKAPREELTETAREVTQGTDNFETMPESTEETLDLKRQRLERLKRSYTPNKKKEITPDKYVISFSHTVKSGNKNTPDIDHYLISIGDPRKQGSKVVGLVQSKEGVQGWLARNKNENISENLIIDASGLNLVSDEHTDDYMNMQSEIKKEIDRLQAELDQSTTTPPPPQRSTPAQAFSNMVDTIKSGERSQAVQRAFKAELNKVIDKAESGTLTDAERAELLPIAEELVEVTSGKPRELMQQIRDQIKG